MQDRLIKLVDEIQPENKKNTLDRIEALLLEQKEISEESKSALIFAITKNYYESYPEVIPLLEKYVGKPPQEVLNTLFNTEVVILGILSVSAKGLDKINGLINAGANIDLGDQKNTDFINTLINKLIGKITPKDKIIALDILKKILTKYNSAEKQLKPSLLHAIKLNCYVDYPEVISLLEKYTGKISQSKLNLELHNTVNSYYSPGRAREIKGLITAGADINIRNSRGNTPLHIAATSGYNNSHYIVKILCDALPSHNTLNGNGDIKDSSEYESQFILSEFILRRMAYTHSINYQIEYSIIKLLVDAGAYIQLWSIIALKEKLKENPKNDANKSDANKTLVEIINFLEEKKEAKKQEIQKMEQYFKNKKPQTEEPESGLELSSYGPEEKRTPEDMFDDFQIQSSNLGWIKSVKEDLFQLIRLSFLNQMPSQQLIAEFQKGISDQKRNSYYHSEFIKIFADMIKFIKYYGGKDPFVINAILNLISHIQNANHIEIFIKKKSLEYLTEEAPLSYSSEYPTIQEALLKFAPYEQCRLLKETNIDSFSKLKIDKLKPTADLYDLLFYLEQRDNNGNTYKVRAQVLFDIVGHLRNKNWPAAFQLVKDRLKDLDTAYSAGLEFFGKTQNVVSILKGIVNRFETIEAFEKHAQGFLQNIDQVKYKILKDQGLVSENSASSSNNNTNGPN